MLSCVIIQILIGDFMQKLVLASANQHKIKEFNAIFKGYEIVPMSEYGYTEDIEENGKTFLENAIIKAKAVSKFLKEKNIEKASSPFSKGHRSSML